MLILHRDFGGAPALWLIIREDAKVSSRRHQFPALFHAEPDVFGHHIFLRKKSTSGRGFMTDDAMFAKCSAILFI